MIILNPTTAYLLFDLSHEQIALTDESWDQQDDHYSVMVTYRQTKNVNKKASQKVKKKIYRVLEFHCGG